MRIITRYLVILFFICGSLSVSVQAQSETEIQQLFQNYMAKYNHYIHTGDLEHEPSLYSEEVMLISERRAPILVSESNLYDQIEVFLDGLKERGVVKVQWEKVEIHLLGDNMALASNIAIRYNANDEVVDRVGASYTLHQSDDEWNIIAFAIHEADRAFSFGEVSTE